MGALLGETNRWYNEKRLRQINSLSAGKGGSPTHVDVIRTALHRSPFEPYVIRLADGRSLSVPHPDFVAVSPRQVVVVNPQDEAVSRFEPLLIVALEFAQPQTGTERSTGAQESGGESQDLCWRCRRPHNNDRDVANQSIWSGCTS
jgi:hypothetical protein